MTKLDMDPRPSSPDPFMGKFSLRSVRPYLKINISPVEQFTVKTVRPFSNPYRTSIGWCTSDQYAPGFGWQLD